MNYTAYSINCTVFRGDWFLFVQAMNVYNYCLVMTFATCWVASVIEYHHFTEILINFAKLIDEATHHNLWNKNRCALMFLIFALHNYFKKMDGLVFVIWRSNFNWIKPDSKVYSLPRVIKSIKSHCQLNILYHAKVWLHELYLREWRLRRV